MEKKLYNAMDIARWFINRNSEDCEKYDEEKMTLLKLLKLLYYGEGSALALGRGSLFPEKIIAWEHGPVVEEVWRKFPDAYNLYVDPDDMQKSLAKITPEDNSLLEDVYNVFGHYTAVGLRNKTHSESPWIDATDGGKHLNNEIKRDDIERYFRNHYVAA